MKCKFCMTEIEEDVTLCPKCGKDLTEAEEKSAAENTAEAAEENKKQTEALLEPEENKEKAGKDGKSLKIVLATIGLVLLAEVLLVAVLHYAGVINMKQVIVKKPASDTTAATNDEAPTQPTKPLVSYTEDNATVKAEGEKVVAKVGNQELTNSELQIHYWTTVSDFVQYYGSYIQYIGLDLNKPLDEQIYDQETGKTYQQWFLENAIESWRRYATLAQMAEDAGFQMTSEQQNELNNMTETIRQQAQTEGFEDVEAYVDKYFPGSSLAGYIKYNTINWKAMCYYNKLHESLLPTQEEVEAYYVANEASFVENKMSKEDGLYYDVRHILIPIEGEIGEVDGVPAYTDEQWAQCKAKAQKALDDFLTAKGDEAAFAQLAKELSADPGSASKGGLYEKLTKDTGFIEPFKTWYLEEDRKPGDTGLVKNTESSTQGYHIMYFCESYVIWECEVKSAILNERTDALLEEAATKWPITTDYESVVLGQIETDE